MVRQERDKMTDSKTGGETLTGGKTDIHILKMTDSKTESKTDRQTDRHEGNQTSRQEG